MASGATALQQHQNKGLPAKECFRHLGSFRSELLFPHFELPWRSDLGCTECSAPKINNVKSIKSFYKWFLILKLILTFSFFYLGRQQD